MIWLFVRSIEPIGRRRCGCHGRGWYRCHACHAAAVLRRRKPTGWEGGRQPGRYRKKNEKYVRRRQVDHVMKWTEWVGSWTPSVLAGVAGTFCGECAYWVSSVRRLVQSFLNHFKCEGGKK
eukprot:356274-Chlamydomonas_euryale.AAC.10